jgi:hypothetical protein
VCVYVVQWLCTVGSHCNTDSIAVGTVQCYQHSVCNNCILSLQLHTCRISEAVHSGRDRLLGIVVSEELSAAVFSVTVCGKLYIYFRWLNTGSFFYLTICLLSLPLACGLWADSTTLIL